jgi:preprotein translocase SecE subunit
VEDAFRELLKVVWPSKAELHRHVAAVLFAVGGVVLVCLAVVLLISVR